MSLIRSNSKGSEANHLSANRGGTNFFGVQAKLEIGKPNDKYEKEADNVADKVVRSTQKGTGVLGGKPFFDPKPNVQKKGVSDSQQGNDTEMLQEKSLADSITPVNRLSDVVSTPVQEKCEACEKEEAAESSVQLVQAYSFETPPDEVPDPVKVQAKCEACEKEEAAAKVQKKGENGSGGSSTEARLKSSKGKGSPMADQTRNEMESGFGADLSDVRIHTGSEAIQMNKELGAQAFTNGNDIYFNQGKYNPNSNEGKHLLAHELTHTIQQNGGSTAPPVQRAQVPDDVSVHTDSKAKEITDERQADAVTQGNDIFVSPDHADSNGNVDSGILNHEMTHVEQQKKYSPQEIGNIDTYSKLENEAIQNEDTASIQRSEDPSVTTEDLEEQQFRRLNAIAYRELGVFQLAMYNASGIETLSEYDAFMESAARRDAEYIKSKLLENWVDSDDESAVISTLMQWAKIPGSSGQNYLDQILTYLRNHSLYMDYFISESVSVTFLEQLFEEMEGVNQVLLQFIIDNYSRSYSGYRGRGGVSLFGSFSNSMMNEEVKTKISTLNKKMSGRSTISMTESEIRRSNELYATIRSRTFGLVDLPHIDIQAAEGQNMAQAIAVPVITVGMVLTALLIALLVTLVLMLILELLRILERAIDRVRTRRRRRRRSCNVTPIGYHRGGNVRHNNCADTVPPNIHPGSDILVENPNTSMRKNFDALGPSRDLWEVKTENYSSYPQFLRDTTIANNMADIAVELPLATSCGYMYYFGVTDPLQYQELLSRVPPGVNVRLMNC